MTQKKLIIIGTFVFAIVFLVTWYVLSCPPLKKCPFLRPPKEKEKKVTLTFASPWDNKKNWQDIISKFNSYKLANGGLDVAVKFENIDDQIYEDEIYERQVNGNSPNMYMIFNAWMPRYEKRVVPMPKEIMSLAQFENTFAKVASEDLIIDGKIYSLPFYIDTLALFYNEDMFFNENISRPPETWDEFRNYVEKLTILDSKGNIVRSGAAFGRGSAPGSVNRNQDIIMLLVMQNNIGKNKNIVSFKNLETIAAVKFYTDFTDPQKRFYTWNENQLYSIDAFIQKKTAMMINYLYQVENIDAKTGGTLDYKVAPIPQVDPNNKINYASYWVPVVAKNAPCNAEKGTVVDCDMLAWEFLDFAAKEKNVVSYLDSTNRPAANLEIAKKQSLEFDDVRSVFASQIFTAKSWKHPDTMKSDRILEDMVDSIVTSKLENKTSVIEAVNSVQIKLEELR